MTKKVTSTKPDQAEGFWKQFADAMHGKYVEWTYWHWDKAVIDSDGWKVIFDHYTKYSTSGILQCNKNIPV